MIFKVTFVKAGGHFHCSLFAAKQQNMTYAKCGDFCVRDYEMPDLRLAMSGVHFEDRTQITEEHRRRRSDGSA